MSETSKPPKRKRGKILLIVSLAFNMIIVGLIIGAIFGGHYRDRRGAQPPLGVRGYLSAMTTPQRRDFMRDYKHGFMGHIKVLKNLNTYQLAIMDAMEADPFDASALIAAMAAQRGKLSDVMAGFHGELANALAEMTHEERKAYVERYKSRAGKRWGRPRKDRREP